jgi:hypothetical protein
MFPRTGVAAAQMSGWRQKAGRMPWVGSARTSAAVEKALHNRQRLLFLCAQGTRHPSWLVLVYVCMYMCVRGRMCGFNEGRHIALQTNLSWQQNKARRHLLDATGQAHSFNTIPNGRTDLLLSLPSPHLQDTIAGQASPCACTPNVNGVAPPKDALAPKGLTAFGGAAPKVGAALPPPAPTPKPPVGADAPPPPAAPKANVDAGAAAGPPLGAAAAPPLPAPKVNPDAIAGDGEPLGADPPPPPPPAPKLNVVAGAGVACPPNPKPDAGVPPADGAAAPKGKAAGAGAAGPPPNPNAGAGAGFDVGGGLAWGCTPNAKPVAGAAPPGSPHQGTFNDVDITVGTGISIEGVTLLIVNFICSLTQSEGMAAWA